MLLSCINWLILVLPQCQEDSSIGSNHLLPSLHPNYQGKTGFQNDKGHQRAPESLVNTPGVLRKNRIDSTAQAMHHNMYHWPGHRQQTK